MFSESPWIELCVGDLLTPLRHPNVAHHSVKVLAIVIFGLSTLPSPPSRNVQLSLRVRAHHS